MWSWIVLAVGWAASGFWAWSAYRRARMASPVNVVAAIASRVRVGFGFGVALVLLLAFAFASLQLALAEKSQLASYFAAASMGVSVIGGLILWKWIWKKRRPISGKPM